MNNNLSNLKKNLSSRYFVLKKEICVVKTFCSWCHLDSAQAILVTYIIMAGATKAYFSSLLLLLLLFSSLSLLQFRHDYMHMLDIINIKSNYCHHHYLCTSICIMFIYVNIITITFTNYGHILISILTCLSCSHIRHFISLTIV